MDWSKTTARRDKKQLSFGVWWLILEVWQYIMVKFNMGGLWGISVNNLEKLLQDIESSLYGVVLLYKHLTHWGWDKMAAIFQMTFSNGFPWMKMHEFFIQISLMFVLKGPINNILALVLIMAWCRSGNKSLSEPMMVRLLTHICITRPQWVKLIYHKLPMCHNTIRSLIYETAIHQQSNHLYEVGSNIMTPLSFKDSYLDIQLNWLVPGICGCYLKCLKFKNIMGVGIVKICWVLCCLDCLHQYVLKMIKSTSNKVG